MINDVVVDSNTYFDHKIFENVNMTDIPKYNKANFQQIVDIKLKLIKMFPDIECFDIVPHQNDQCEQLGRIYTQQIYSIRERLLSKTFALNFEGTSLSPRMMLTYIFTILNKLNVGSKMYLSEVWKCIQQNECFSSYNEAIEFYLQKLKENFEKMEEPYRIAELTKIIKIIREEAFDLYFSCIQTKKHKKGFYEDYLKKLQDHINTKE